MEGEATSPSAKKNELIRTKMRSAEDEAYIKDKWKKCSN